MQHRVVTLFAMFVIAGCGRDVSGPTLVARASRTPTPPPPADPAIAYGSRTGKSSSITYGLAVMNADGSNQTVLVAADQAPHPSWSPDGHSIAYHSSGYDLKRVDVSVVNGIPVASAPVTLPITHLAFDIAWSPDASNPQIAYSQNQSDLGAAAGLYLVPANPVSPYDETLLYLGPSGNRMIWIAWNPSATRIAFIQRSIDVPVDSLFILDVGTRNTTFVREFKRGVMGLSWSRTPPDRLALSVPRPDNSLQPSFLDLTTNTLSNAPGGIAAKFSPDDSRLVFMVSSAGGQNTNAIYTVALSTGSQSKLLDNGFEPEWRRNP